MFFFKYAEETNKKDLKKIAREAPIIKRAYNKLDRFNWNEKDLTAYKERIMDLYKEEAILEHKLAEDMKRGMEKGIKKGREEGKIEVAKAMLANNFDVETIAKFTSFSISEIKELSETSERLCFLYWVCDIVSIISVPLPRLELGTSSLPMMYSTT